MAPMDSPGAGAGLPDPAAEKDPRELDASLEGTAGDSYVKCGKCQACYPMDLEVRFLAGSLACFFCSWGDSYKCFARNGRHLSLLKRRRFEI